MNLLRKLLTGMTSRSDSPQTKCCEISDAAPAGGARAASACCQIEDTQIENKTKAHKVSFELHAPKATAVVLAGSFNEWKTDGTPLIKERDGRWSVSLPLNPGQHEYRYIVDGEWVSDETKPAVANPFGGSNNIVEV